MGKFIDLTGQRFGRLTVLERDSTSVGVVWLCRCDCGAELKATRGNLRSGNTKSCGCIHKEQLTRRLTKHGDRGQDMRLYNIWRNMRQRCNNPQQPRFKDYGGRGITVCPEWENYPAFKSWALANGYEEHLTIDRIDNDGSYSPNNCRWATATVQNSNRSRRLS